MKNILALFIIFAAPLLFSQDFVRPLPNLDYASQLTQDKFPNSNAVIIIKEQSINITPENVTYKGNYLWGLSCVETECTITKLFNEAAVEKYGSFEYEYSEEYGDELPAGIIARARVMKPSGKIEVLPEKEIKNIVSLADNNGKTLMRKVLFKIPNLAIGDIVQIEYQINKPLQGQIAGVFYYNDRDPILFSNAYLTMPIALDIDGDDLPDGKVGPPKIEQISKEYGAGKTLFWSVRNLNGIPKEPYSQPFEDQSYMTLYTMRAIHGDQLPFSTKSNLEWSDWPKIGKYFFSTYIDRDGISSGNYDLLKADKDKKGPTLLAVDSLYGTIKRFFKIRNEEKLTPLPEIDEAFRKKSASPTDAAFIMYKILQGWNIDSKIAFVHDRRDGAFDKSFPAPNWFSHICVKVTIDGKEAYYDFDRAAPNKYSAPSFLKGIDVFCVGPAGSDFSTVDFPFGPENNVLSEQHTTQIGEGTDIADTLALGYTGFFAEQLRTQFYSEKRSDITEFFGAQFGSPLFIKTDTVSNNDIFEEPGVHAVLTGKSAVKAETIDTFLVIKQKEKVFMQMHDKLLAPSRKGSICFPAPFRIEYTNKLLIPAGYEVKSGLFESSSSGPNGSKFTYKVTKDDKYVYFKGVLEMPMSLLPAESYPSLMRLLETATKKIGNDFIFRKKHS